jgi:hypothetical protein
MQNAAIDRISKGIERNSSISRSWRDGGNSEGREYGAIDSINERLLRPNMIRDPSVEIHKTTTIYPHPTNHTTQLIKTQTYREKRIQSNTLPQMEILDPTRFPKPRNPPRMTRRQECLTRDNEKRTQRLGMGELGAIRRRSAAGIVVEILLVDGRLIGVMVRGVGSRRGGLRDGGGHWRRTREGCCGGPHRWGRSVFDRWRGIGMCRRRGR